MAGNMTFSYALILNTFRKVSIPHENARQYSPHFSCASFTSLPKTPQQATHSSDFCELEELQGHPMKPYN